jgi:hypothetical protein
MLAAAIPAWERHANITEIDIVCSNSCVRQTDRQTDIDVVGSNSSYVR